MRDVWIAGVRVDDVSMLEAVERSLEENGETKWVVTPNAVMLDACQRDARLAELLNRASLSLADGAGVMLAARRQRTPLCERIAGIEFGERLMSEAASRGLRVFLLGGGDGVAQEAALRLQRRYAGLRICGSCWGYFEKDGDEDRRVVSYIRACRPDILLVCFGFPMQERWIGEHMQLFDGIRVVAGLGGALDVWSGRAHRAPAPFSRMGLEWAWRMAHQPKRLKHLPAIVRCAVGWKIKKERTQY